VRARSLADGLIVVSCGYEIVPTYRGRGLMNFAVVMAMGRASVCMEVGSLLAGGLEIMA
jgi:hypothetical protein